MDENSAHNLNINEIPKRAIYPSHEARMLLGGISESTFRRQYKSGRLVAKKIGAFVYVESDEIKRFLAGLPLADDAAAEIDLAEAV